MKKSWMLILVGTLLAAGGLAMSARAQSNVVYAVEFNQSPNRFGTINLWNGNFTQIATIGTLINDLAYCPTNGMLYGILNSTTLVTLNETNGAITSIAPFSVSGIQSLAFRPSDGVLFGATQTGLYTVNPATGAATPVGSGSFGGPPNLNNQGQNIRFAQDGNLYISNTSMNTDIYRISTMDGSATWVGEVIGIPYLMLMNGDNYMYGVYINLGSSSGPQNTLTSFDLTSFVEGGTNANGSTHQISLAKVGAGTNFPINFIFSGIVSQPVTNLTVPVSAAGPSDQTVCPESTVVFSTVASGSGPYSYTWLKNDSTISDQTNSSLMLNNVTTNDAATYSVIVGGAIGTVTNSATLTLNAPVNVTVPPVSQTTVVGSNVMFSVTATGMGLSYQWLFDGSVIETESSLTLNNVTASQAGVYTVIVSGTCGSMTNSATLTVTKADATVTLGNLNQVYDGTAKAATATTTPSGLAVTFTYNGSATVPTAAGSYTVVGTINDADYQGSATGTLVIGHATGSITLGDLSQTYTGSAKAATATTTPSGLAVSFTYNGSATVPTSAGSYTVIGTINDANYQGSATNTLVISKGTSAISLGSLSQTYDGTAKAATATTTPSGLAVTFTYNGSATIPTSAGSYTVIGTINDANYQGSATNTLVINKGTSAISLGSLSQTYDGTAKAATVTTTPSGLAVTFTYNGSATIPTSAGSYTVVGTINDANYQGSATNTLVIARATLTITAVPNTKTYDGTTSAAAKPSVSGLQGSDSVTGLTETYDTKDVVTGKTLNVSAYMVNDGNSGNNYTVSTATSTAGVINKAALTVTAAANTKTYDGTISAAATPTTSGLQGSDSVTGLTEIYDTKNAGTGKTLSVSAYTVNDGNSGNNYTVSTVTSTAGVIDPATLTINAAPNTKTYDGTTSAAAIPTVGGLQGFDSVTGLAETYDTKNAGIGKTLSVSAYTVNDGNGGNNYTVSTVGNTNNIASTAGVITPATLTLTADNKTKIYGMPNPPLTASYNGFVDGESANVLSSPAVLSTTATTTSGAGTYPITVSGAADVNYTIQYADGTLQVFSAPQLAGANINVSGKQQFVVNWPTIAGQTYQLEYTTNLVAAKWTTLGTPFAGTDGIMAVTNNIGSTPQCFYRVQVQ